MAIEVEDAIQERSMNELNDDVKIENGLGQGPLVQRMLYWLVAEIRWLVRVFLSSGDRFYWDNGFSRAASLAYTSLLSIFPVTALIFGLLAFFAVSGENIVRVREFVFRQFIPDTHTVDKVLEFMEQFSRVVTDPGSSFNLLVFASLLVTSILLINSIEYALNEIWQVFEPRSIIDRVSIFCAVLLLAPVLTLSAYFFTKLRIEPFLDNAAVTRAYAFLLPFLIDFLAFFCLNYLVPKAPVKIRSAVFGAAVSALLFGAAKGGFALYVERFASYDRLYGALAAIPVFLVWLYVSWIVMLIGAEVSYQAQYLPRFGKVWRRSVMSVGDAHMLLAVQALVMVARAYAKGASLPNEIDVAEQLGCSSTVLKPALAALNRAGLLTRGSSREMPLTFMRTPERILLIELRDALFQKRRAIHFPAELRRLFGAFEDETRLASATLADVLKEGEAIPP